MTTRELYKAIGVAGYEPLGCWRKEGIFATSGSARPIDVPSVEIATSFGEWRIASFMLHESVWIVRFCSSKLPVLNVVSASVLNAAFRGSQMQLHKEFCQDRCGSAV
ncbi:MAG: hypothetical protein U0936_12835 [Planctomycetaceae bacterium]